jgi:outer membrane lipase/esterase
MAHKRTRKMLVLACALACAAPASRAADFNGTIFFGDSLTDSGVFGARFTTNPGKVWAQLIAERLGSQGLPFNQGGSNFAVGGARVSLLPGIPPSPPTDSAPPITDQISTYLGSSGGSASGRALYTVWGGANDVFAASSLADVMLAAGELAAQVDRLRAAGARFIVVPKVPDIGATPFGASQGPAGQAALTQLSSAYNQTLYSAIAARGLRVIAVDTFALLNEVLADPAAYGFVNTAVPACGATPSLVCTPADLVAPNAAQTFLFADGVHPTTAGHAVIADYVASILAAPGQISLLAESALKTRSALVDRLYVRMQEPPAGRSLWLSVDGQRTSFDSAAGHGAGITIGVDLYRQPGMVFGGAVGFGSIKPQFGTGGDFRQEETSLSLYGGWRGGPWHVGGALTYGSLDYDVNREIRLGAATRSATGSPGGRNLSVGIEGGYRNSRGRLSHGPLASLLVQQAKVDAFSEAGGGSASLRFGEQSRSSAIGRLGWQLAYDAGRWQPYARLTLDRELRDPQRDVEAQLVGEPGLPNFALPAAAPGRTFATVLAGSSVRIAQGWSGQLGISQTLGQSGAKATGVFASLAANF